MSEELYDAYGNRKYVVPIERQKFVSQALNETREFAAFCLTLTITGARISEVLHTERKNIDTGDGGIIFQTLKQRGKKKFRLVPIPPKLLSLLLEISDGKSNERIWSYGRTFAWQRVKRVMHEAGIAAPQCMPKALRHGFAVEAVLNGIPLNVVQRWMGHARLETTAIYASVWGDEERALARRVWASLESAIPNKREPVSQVL